MSNILYFPRCRPEPEDIISIAIDEIPEININELIDDIDYTAMYAENEDYECLKCGCTFNENNQAWRIDYKPDKSILDNYSDEIAIAVCDNCIAAWLHLEIENKKNIR